MTTTTETIMALADAYADERIKFWPKASGDNNASRAALQSAIDALVRDASPLSRIDKECLRIGQEIQRAAGELPEYFELEVYVERGYGCVYLRNPSSDVSNFDDTVDGLSHCITQAIDAAIAAQDVK